jgi:hypothetical protein
MTTQYTTYQIGHTYCTYAVELSHETDRQKALGKTTALLAVTGLVTYASLAPKETAAENLKVGGLCVMPALVILGYMVYNKLAGPLKAAKDKLEIFYQGNKKDLFKIGVWDHNRSDLGLCQKSLNDYSYSCNKSNKDNRMKKFTPEHRKKILGYI